MTTATIDKSIDVDRSRHDAFEKLSRVETFAQFQSQLAGVEGIQVTGANTAHVVEVVEGQREEFDIELSPVPEERIGYRIGGEAPMDGTLTLEQLDEQHTKLRLHVEYDPQKVSDVYKVSQQELDEHLQQRLEGMKSLAEREPE